MADRWREQTAGTGIPAGDHARLWTFGAPVTAPDLRKARKWLLISGILALTAGMIAIAVPIIASVTVAILIGWVLIFASVTMATHAWSSRSVWRALEALLTFVVGFYLLVFPLTGTVTLTFVLAVWFFASGVMQLTYAWQWRQTPGAGLAALGGALSIILGFLIAVNLPSSSAWAIGLLVGINLVFWGVRALVGAQLLKTISQI